MDEDQKIPLIVVVGPTASGKTKLAVALAKRFDGEVVSADSMQIYREMAIGTARPTEGEMQGVPHHLVGCCAVTEVYNVARYAEAARDVIRDIHARGKRAVLCGGTGLYVQAVVDQVEYADEKRDDALRAALQQRAEQEGGGVLLRELADFDPETAARLHPNNVGRIIRAIEIYRQTGVTMSEQIRRSRLRPPPYRLCMLGVAFRDRERLYRRIDSRVDQMLADGLLGEAEQVLSLPGGKTAAQAIGYKELAPYLRGETSLPEAVARLKQETRRYAKRQLTWFRRDSRIFWLYGDDYPNWMEMFGDACRTVEQQLGL